MENPKYILKTNEAVLMSKNQSSGIKFLKIGVLVVIGIIILGSLIFQDNLFFELSWSTRILLIVVATGVLFGGKKEYVSSPMELQFYDDYLVLYLPRRYYSSRVTRMEVNTMNYNEISKCVYKAKSNRIQIYGDGKSIWYNYNKDGSLPKKPTEERCYSQGMIYFNTQLATDINFKNEIENHSPLQVIIENS